MLFSAVPFKSSLSLSVSLSLTSCPSLGGAVAQQSCLTDSQPSSGARFAETPRPSQHSLAGFWKSAHPTLPLKTLKDAVFGFLFIKFLVPSKPFYLL